MQFSYISGQVLEHPLSDGFYTYSNPEYKKHELKEFGVGQENPKGLKLDYHIEGFKMVMNYQVAADFVGPPGFVHGGILATILDDAMGCVVMAAKPNRFSMTARLTTHYIKPTPLETPIVIEAWVTTFEGKKTFAQGAIYPADKQEVWVEAESLFIEVAKI